jgi:hypothetical protein
MKRAIAVLVVVLIAIVVIVLVQRTRGVGVKAVGAVDASATTTIAAPAVVAETEAVRPRRATPPTAAAPVPRLVVAFHLDPDITRGLFLGDRWVSPPSFAFAQPGNRYVVHARMQQIGTDGERTDVSGQWATSDPDMMALTPEDDGAVRIEIDEVGSAQLRAVGNGETKILQVNARKLDDAMEVEFRQQ